MNKILIIVDLQQDFTHGSLGGDSQRSIIPNVVTKVKNAMKNDIPIVFTLDTLNTNNIEILEEHTDSHHNASIFRYVNLKQYATFIGDDTMFVFPDKGASERHPVIYNLLGYYDKQRVGDNIEVKFNQQKLLQEETDIIVFDDICDGGGTFVKVAEDLHKRFPNTRIHLFVTHAIQKSGIEKVAALYDWVFITNSYKSWELEELPDNVQVIGVI